jgi:hypothetical protein
VAREAVQAGKGGRTTTRRTGTDWGGGEEAECAALEGPGTNGAGGWLSIQRPSVILRTAKLCSRMRSGLQADSCWLVSGMCRALLLSMLMWLALPQLLFG